MYFSGWDMLKSMIILRTKLIFNIHMDQKMFCDLLGVPFLVKNSLSLN